MSNMLYSIMQQKIYITHPSLLFVNLQISFNCIWPLNEIDSFSKIRSALKGTNQHHEARKLAGSLISGFLQIQPQIVIGCLRV